MKGPESWLISGGHLILTIIFILMKPTEPLATSVTKLTALKSYTRPRWKDHLNVFPSNVPPWGAVAQSSGCGLRAWYWPCILNLGLTGPKVETICQIPVLYRKPASHNVCSFKHFLIMSVYWTEQSKFSSNRLNGLGQNRKMRLFKKVKKVENPIWWKWTWPGGCQRPWGDASDDTKYTIIGPTV